MSGEMVYVVVCIAKDGDETHHIFSSPEKAQAYADQDADRAHVLYGYALDFPEHHEGVMQ